MGKNKINKLLFASLLLIAIVSFTLEDQYNNDYSINTVIANIDQATNSSFINENKSDNSIIHGKFAGMLEAEFNNNSTKISFTESKN